MITGTTNPTTMQTGVQKPQIPTVHELRTIVINTVCMHTDSNWSLSTERLDSAYGWLPWPDTLPPAPLGLLPDPCQPLEGTPLDGRIALVLLSDDWHEKPCSAAQIVRSAQVGESLSSVSTGCPCDNTCCLCYCTVLE